MDKIKLAQRTIALLSSMIESGECHTSRSREMKDNALNGLEQLRLGAVIFSCYMCSKRIDNPLEQFDMYGEIVCQDCYDYNQYQALQDMGGV